jgi:CRISPR/Cas system CSM-associated protein Csm2 small subunit
MTTIQEAASRAIIEMCTANALRRQRRAETAERRDRAPDDLAEIFSLIIREIDVDIERTERAIETLRPLTDGAVP